MANHTTEARVSNTQFKKIIKLINLTVLTPTTTTTTPKPTTTTQPRFSTKFFDPAWARNKKLISVPAYFSKKILALKRFPPSELHSPPKDIARRPVFENKVLELIRTWNRKAFKLQAELGDKVELKSRILGRSGLEQPEKRIVRFPDDDGYLTCFHCHAANMTECYETGYLAHCQEEHPGEFFYSELKQFI